jgi:hypothetical protein
MPDPEDLVTVAVKVTGLPRPDGLGEELRAVVVATMVTTWVTTLEVLALNEPGTPSYTAST